MKLATWNVNSIRARLPRVLEFVDEYDPDLLLLQEIKVEDNDFPTLEFQDRGYTCYLYGQKSYNGVAILSKHELDNIQTGLPNFKDDAARMISGQLNGITIASVYAPNGNPVGSDNFNYKENWLSHFIDHARDRMDREEPILFGGDFNIIPYDYDCHDVNEWAGDAIISDVARSAYHQLEGMGYHDVWRGYHPDDQKYSYWDYQSRAFDRNAGCRIDYFLASPEAVDITTSADIIKKERAKEKPSDHVPVMIEVDIATN